MIKLNLEIPIMSLFSEFMKKAISIYRYMLRKHVPQAIRIAKLQQLNLKNPHLYENEIALYHTGYAIISDIEKNLDPNLNGYYSYCGISNFSDYLKNFLNSYIIEGNRVIHRSQKASRALVQAIQLLSLPKEELTRDIAEQLSKCNGIIAQFGSQEQKDMHKTSLQHAMSKKPQDVIIFYRSILSNYQEYLKEKNKHK